MVQAWTAHGPNINTPRTSAGQWNRCSTAALLLVEIEFPSTVNRLRRIVNGSSWFFVDII